MYAASEASTDSALFRSFTRSHPGAADSLNGAPKVAALAQAARRSSGSAKKKSSSPSAEMAVALSAALKPLAQAVAGGMSGAGSAPPVANRVALDTDLNNLERSDALQRAIDQVLQRRKVVRDEMKALEGSVDDDDVEEREFLAGELKRLTRKYRALAAADDVDGLAAALAPAPAPAPAQRTGGRNGKGRAASLSGESGDEGDDDGFQ